MISFAALALSILAAASGDCVFGVEVPEGVPTFRMSDAGGAEDYVAVRIGGEWSNDAAAITSFHGSVELYYDTPWIMREPVKIYPAKLSFVYESPVIRKERLTRGWESAGYVFVKNAAGCQPVLTAELELSKRAQAMEAALLESGKDTGEAASASAEPAPSGPGWLALWGGHLMVAAITLALIGVVAKVAFFSE